jgi:hypothetical protein
MGKGGTLDISTKRNNALDLSLDGIPHRQCRCWIVLGDVLDDADEVGMILVAPMQTYSRSARLHHDAALQVGSLGLCNVPPDPSRSA